MVPFPLDKVKSPDDPARAVPVAIVTTPDDPVDDTPVNNCKEPLAPLAPAFAVLTTTFPLEDSAANPLEINTLPPVVPPAAISILAP